MKTEHEPAPLGVHVEVEADEARLSRSWSAISARLHTNERPTKASRPSMWQLGGVAGVGLSVAAAVVLWLGSPAPGPLVTTAGASLEAAIASTRGAASVVALSDGSEITTDEGTVLETLESSATRAAFALRSGRVRLSITPGGPRRWSVEAGLVSVEVVGTIFTVDRGENGVEVSVERGRVLVRGEGVPDGVRTLVAGEHLTVVEPAPVATVTAAVPTPVVEPSSAALAPVSARSPDRTPAVTEAVVPGREPDAEALLAAADEARHAGRIEEALALLALATELEGDPSAPLAGLTRGRMLLERDRPAEAARDLRAALAAGLPGGLAESARARLVEALVAAGDHEAAAREAETYHRLHPDGAARERIRVLVP